jgi:hypothetical protein
MRGRGDARGPTAVKWRVSPPVAALFRPLSVEAFLGEWWGRRSLHLPGPPDKFAGFYTLDAFLRRVDGGWPAARVPVRAVFERGEVDDATRPSRYITPAEIRGAFAEGATICISQFDRVDADVAALCDEARAALGCWQEATMQAGDLLCLPAGALHAARAVGHSFALNLHFNPLPVGGWLGGLLDGRLGDAAG